MYWFAFSSNVLCLPAPLSNIKQWLREKGHLQKKRYCFAEKNIIHDLKGKYKTGKRNVIRLKDNTSYLGPCTNMHVFGLWEEAGEIRENPHMHREHANSTQKGPSRDSDQEPFCFDLTVLTITPPWSHKLDSLTFQPKNIYYPNETTRSKWFILTHLKHIWKSFILWTLSHLKKMEIVTLTSYNNSGV